MRRRSGFGAGAFSRFNIAPERSRRARHLLGQRDKQALRCGASSLRRRSRRARRQRGRACRRQRRRQVDVVENNCRRFAAGFRRTYAERQAAHREVDYGRGTSGNSHRFTRAQPLPCAECRGKSRIGARRKSLDIPQLVRSPRRRSLSGAGRGCRAQCSVAQPPSGGSSADRNLSRAAAEASRSHPR